MSFETRIYVEMLISRIATSCHLCDHTPESTSWPVVCITWLAQLCQEETRNILLLCLLHVTFKQLPVSKEDAQFRTRWMRRGRRPSRAFAPYMNDWQHVRARSMLGGCLIQRRLCLTNKPSNIRFLQEKRQTFSLTQWWVVIVTGSRVKGKGLRGIGKYILVQS